MSEDAYTLRARWIVPIAGRPIESGLIEIARGRILRVGKISAHRSGSGGPTRDLGDVAILPGLVNAHTHLEFSNLESPIGAPGGTLADWVVDVVQARRNAAANLPGGEPDSVITQGVREARDSGTALLGEIATTPWPMVRRPLSRRPLSRRPLSRRPLAHPADPGTPEIVAFAEVLGLSPQRAEEHLGRAEEHFRAHAPRAGISPHAPYSTPPALIQKCVDFAIENRCPLAMHVAESPAERELMQHGRGAFAENLAGLGLDISATFPWPDRNPLLALIDLLARAPAAMLIHGNDLRPDEIARIASHDFLSVVYCPRTHAFFGYPPHPVAELVDAGINVALGTDSRASNPDLQLWREVRWLLQHRQDLAPDLVLRLATLGGAIAMRRDKRYGTLLPQRLARFALVPTSASNLDSLYADFASSDARSAEAPHN